MELLTPNSVLVTLLTAIGALGALAVLFTLAVRVNAGAVQAPLARAAGIVRAYAYAYTYTAPASLFRLLHRWEAVAGDLHLAEIRARMRALGSEYEHGADTIPIPIAVPRVARALHALAHALTRAADRYASAAARWDAWTSTISARQAVPVALVRPVRSRSPSRSPSWSPS